MHRSIIVIIIVTLIISLCWSNGQTSSVFGKPKGHFGDLLCLDHNGDPKIPEGQVRCCQNEYDSNNRVIHDWCTTCANTNPPSNCSPREDILKFTTSGETHGSTGGLSTLPSDSGGNTNRNPSNNGGTLQFNQP